MTTFNTVSALGLNVFYREAGDPAAPKLLLLGGFPASSHQFRNLIPALADRFHVVSFDYPGFGNTEMPDPATWEYTFDHLAEVVEAAMEAIGFTGTMGFYMQDYGGPIGNRLIAKHPDWLGWQVIQNANSYEEGFTATWDGIRHVLWANRDSILSQSDGREFAKRLNGTFTVASAPDGRPVDHDWMFESPHLFVAHLFSLDLLALEG